MSYLTAGIYEDVYAAAVSAIAYYIAVFQFAFLYVTGLCVYYALIQILLLIQPFCLVLVSAREVLIHSAVN